MVFQGTAYTSFANSLKGSVANYDSSTCTNLNNYKIRKNGVVPATFNYLYQNCNITSVQGLAINSSMQLAGSTGYDAIKASFTSLLNFMTLVDNYLQPKSVPAYTTGLNLIKSVNTSITSILNAIQQCEDPSKTLCNSCNQTPFTQLGNVLSTIAVDVYDLINYWTLYY